MKKRETVVILSVSMLPADAKRLRLLAKRTAEGNVSRAVRALLRKVV